MTSRRIFGREIAFAMRIFVCLAVCLASYMSYLLHRVALDPTDHHILYHGHTDQAVFYIMDLHEICFTQMAKATAAISFASVIYPVMSHFTTL